MLRSANLESRQSGAPEKIDSATDAPLREFGIKAKLHPRAVAGHRRCSAPRIWNQGKATMTRLPPVASMLRSANLESRQSSGGGRNGSGSDAPLREFGIKAKRRSGRLEHRGDAPLREFGIKAKLKTSTADGSAGCSAPRIWNQGKAETSSRTSRTRMLRSANLESRQSAAWQAMHAAFDAPLREFGIKAKPGRIELRLSCGCSAPRIWNQGKAASRPS